MRSSLRDWRVRRRASPGFVSVRGIGHVRPWRRLPAQPGSCTGRGVQSARDWPRPGGTLTPSRLRGSSRALPLHGRLSPPLRLARLRCGGADSYGYAGQARLLRHGTLTETIPLDPGFRWPDARATLIPLGFTGGSQPAVMAPLYPPGLPLMMAAFGAVAEPAIFLVVPLFGVLAVWCTWRLGASLGQPLAGALAAVFLSVSPTFLYQLVQPMGDVPAAACWLAALIAASRQTQLSAGGAGMLTALAIAIRPNLAPLAGLILLPILTAAGGVRWRRLAAFAAALAPA